MVAKVKCINSRHAADLVTEGKVYECLNWAGGVALIIDDSGRLIHLMSKRFEVIEDTPTNILEITW